MADPFHSRPAPPRAAAKRARQRTGSVSTKTSTLPPSSSAQSLSTADVSDAPTRPRASLPETVSAGTLMTHLRELLVAKTNEIQLAGRLGETLLHQQAELEKRLREIGAVKDVSGAEQSSLDGSTSLNSSGDPADDVRRKLESLEAEMAQWERNNEEMYRNAGIARPAGEESKIEKSVGTGRRERNNAPARGDDLELATEIGQSLLGEVRRLQCLVNERDEFINTERDAKDRLEKDLETSKSALKASEESIDRYKEENWNLELSVQEMTSSTADAVEMAQRAEAERVRLTKALANARESYDATRAEADRHVLTIESLKNKHEMSMAEARKTTASLQREKSDLQQTLDAAHSQLNARNVRRSTSVGLESPNTSLQIPPSASKADQHQENDEAEAEDPFLGRSTGDMGRPRGSIMPAAGSPAPSLHSIVDSPMFATNDVVQLKQALAHRHKTIEALRAALQREKEARIRGKRANAADDDESPDGSPVQARKVSRRGVNRRGISSMRGRMASRATVRYTEGDEIEEMDSFGEKQQTSSHDGPESFDESSVAGRAAGDISSTFDPAFGGDNSFAASLPGERAPSIRRLSRGSIASSTSDADHVSKTELATILETHSTALLQAGREHEAALQQLRDDHSAALQEMALRHLHTVENLRSTHATDLEHLRHEHTSKLQKSDAQRAAIESQHEAALKRLEMLNSQALSEASALHAGQIDSLRQSYEAQLADLRAELATALSERDAALAKLQRAQEKALSALRAEHDDAMASVVGSHEAELSDLRHLHRTALEQSLQSLRNEHIDALAVVESKHTRALEDARMSAANEADAIRRELTFSMQTKQRLNVEHAAAIESLKTEHVKHIDELSNQHAARHQAQSLQNAENSSRMQREHEHALELRDAISKSNLEELQQRLSTEQEAALAAATASEEQAAAVQSLNDVHNKAMAAAAARHAAELADSRAARLSEQLKLEKILSQTLEEQKAQALVDMQALRDRLAEEQKRNLASMAEEYATNLEALTSRHADHIERTRLENAAALVSAQRAAEDDKQAALADLGSKHAVIIDAMRGKHERDLAAQRSEHDSSIRDLNDRHAAEASTVEHENKLLIAQTTRDHAAAMQEAKAAYVRLTSESAERHQSILQAAKQDYERTLQDITAAHSIALETAAQAARAAVLAEATPRRRLSTLSDDGYKTAHGDETEGEETDFEDAVESLVPANRSGRVVSGPTTPRKVAPLTIDVGIQTDETERPASIRSLASSAATMLPPPLPIINAGADKSKPPVLTMPPPPTVPPPRALSPRKSAASTHSSRAPPTRPISPPPADLLQRATTPGLLMPTTARQESVGGKTASPVKRPRTAASVPSLAPSATKGPRLAASVTEFGAVARAAKHPLQTSAASSTSSRRSRAPSVASSHTSEGEHTNFGPAPPLPGAAWRPHDGLGTDPIVIHAITQTMIGEFLYKYKRRALGKGFSESRHKRYFWVHPYTKTLYWSSTDPGGQYVAHQSTAKSVLIEGVHEVYDPNPTPPGICQHSLIVRTPGRDLKLTAQTQERHEVWLSAIQYLLARPDADSPTSSRMGGSFSPATLNRAGSSIGMHRDGSQQSSGPSIKSPDSVSMNRWGSKSRSRMSAASALQLKRADTPAAQYLREIADFGSPRSVRSFGGSDTMFNDDSFEHVAADNGTFEHEQVEDDGDDDDNFDGLENPRVCCGSHDVGRLSRQSRRSHVHEHAHEAERPISPTWSERFGRASTSHRSGRKSVASMRSQRTVDAVPPLPSNHLV